MSSDTLMQVPYCQIPNVIVHNSPLGLCIMHPICLRPVGLPRPMQDPKPRSGTSGSCIHFYTPRLHSHIVPLAWPFSRCTTVFFPYIITVFFYYVYFHISFSYSSRWEPNLLVEATNYSLAYFLVYTFIQTCRLVFPQWFVPANTEVRHLLLPCTYLFTYWAS
jgi:hypothetical protein